MKCIAALCAAFLSAYTLLTCLPVHGEEEIYSQTIRLHVLANSDSEEDQAEKLLVRDAVLAYLEDSLAQSGSYDSALSAVSDHLEGIRKRAEESLGNKYAVRVELGREKYPVRQYENYSLPAGEYTSLRVLIGEGEGKNWWCVLFPRLCTSRATEEEMYEEFIAAGFSPEQYRLIKNESSPKYKIRFRILEILSEWTGLDY
jgi:stage II sporulation protein R